MSKNEMEILGEQVLEDLAIGDDGGFNVDFLINSASELAKRGYGQYESQQAADKASKATAAQVAKAISADANWANAEALLMIANASHDVARIAPAQVLQQSTMAAALSAGSGLTGDALGQRVAADQKAADQATNNAVANPHDTLAQAKMQAWQKVLAGVQMGGSSGASGSSSGLHPLHHASGNFLTKMAGPLPVWGWGVAGVVAVAATTIIIKAVRK